ncbi:hypothetical protein JF66_06240 [Cryobacterium sp. MLB-32]|uniref:hypothetical protein n=1 Tax=Cryobacterium sp. MLB-32 TaxID=1529318 RepID=UPI0004E72F0C|nr:hypothetical protein [Cryobacterium sp. MLB-32]KFF60192.1 hypothetical protein JF66_06240 [Cryobacterium sp. MLB-32]
MTLSPTADPLALLDLAFDQDVAELLDAMPEEREAELWWDAHHSTGLQTAWSVGFLHDLIGVVDAGANFPFAVIGDRNSGRWMQLFGTPALGYSVELSTDGSDNMWILGEQGGDGTPATIQGAKTTLIASGTRSWVWRRRTTLWRAGC